MEPRKQREDAIQRSIHSIKPVDYAKRRQRRRLSLAARRLLVLFGALGALGLAAFLVAQGVRLLSRSEGEVPVASASAPAAEGGEEPQAQSLPPATGFDPAGAGHSALPEGGVDKSSWNFLGTVEGAAPAVAPTPDYRMVALPANGRVDIRYFNTVTFVGDSLTQGLQIYSTGLPGAQYCAYKGIGPKQMYDGSMQRRNDGGQEIPLDALRDSAPDNVYIQLGANAMVYMDDDSIIMYYEEMLNHMRAALHPEVSFYVQSLTPVRPDNQPGFDPARIALLNDRLAEMTQRQGVYFIDLTEPLEGTDGYLREDFTGGDGYHLNQDGYAAWVEHLMTHTAWHPRNPYVDAEGNIISEEARQAIEAAEAEKAAAAAAAAEAAAAEAAAAEAAAAEGEAPPAEAPAE